MDLLARERSGKTDVGAKLTLAARPVAQKLEHPPDKREKKARYLPGRPLYVGEYKAARVAGLSSRGYTVAR